MVAYSLFQAVTASSPRFVGSTFALLIQIQAAAAFLWHFDIIGSEESAPLACVRACD